MTAALAEQDDATAVAATKPDAPKWYRVVLTHPMHNGRTVFRSVSQDRARAFIERRFPRGSEAYLLTPEGDSFHCEMERTGERGADAPRWAPFDPTSWLPPSQAEPPGQDAWSDKEG